MKTVLALMVALSFGIASALTGIPNDIQGFANGKKW
jgi:hypothetical protein